jgi:RNA polymerase sigma factor (sigma-70 family)
VTPSKKAVPTSEAEAVKMFRPFVLREASQFAKGGVSKDDLVQEGLIAVAMAFRSWREDGGASFLAWIRKPVWYAMNAFVRVHKRGGGTFRHGRRTANKVNSVQLVSMDAQLNDEDEAGDEGLHGVIGTDEEPADSLALELLPGLLAQLDARERKVLRLRYEGDLTYAQVGLRLRISRERARQIEQTALVRLKELMAKEERES